MNGLLTPQRSAGTIIELSFRLLGRTIPVDHGYALYAALSRVAPELHDAQDLGIQPVRGVYVREALSTRRCRRVVGRHPHGSSGATTSRALGPSLMIAMTI